MLRAKHKESGEWVYSDNTKLIMTEKGSFDVYLVRGDTYYLVFYDTIRKSVGADKNGERIFENDIVKTKDGIGVVELDDDASQVVIRYEHFAVVFDNDIEMRVIGNTFDGITDERWL